MINGTSISYYYLMYQSETLDVLGITLHYHNFAQKY